MTPSEVVFDPFSEEYFNSPWEIYRRMREEAPVYYNAEQDFYALSRHADVAAAFKDHETFSSAYGLDLAMVKSGEPLPIKMIILMDPPEHRQVDAAQAVDPAGVVQVRGGGERAFRTVAVAVAVAVTIGINRRRCCCRCCVCVCVCGRRRVTRLRLRRAEPPVREHRDDRERDEQRGDECQGDRHGERPEQLPDEFGDEALCQARGGGFSLDDYSVRHGGVS